MTKRNLKVNIAADSTGVWTLTTDRDGSTKSYTLAFRIASEHDALYDVSGRVAQVPVFINITEQDSDRPSFMATRGTIRVNRAFDGTVFDYEAEADFGERTPVNAKTKRGVAEALVSAQAQSWLTGQTAGVLSTEAVFRGDEVVSSTRI